MDEAKGNPLGQFCWNELMTRDAEAAKKFYSILFGWEMKPSPLHGAYSVLMNRGKDIGGIMQMGDEFPKDVPPHWMAYVAVEDVDKTCEMVKELGGKVCVPPTDIPNMGRFAVIRWRQETAARQGRQVGTPT